MLNFNIGLKPKGKFDIDHFLLYDECCIVN